MAFAQLSAVRLEYFKVGTGPRRVLFIHGFQASGQIWHAVQQSLPGDQYMSLAINNPINNRGAGGSDVPGGEAHYGVGQFAADAFELAEQLGWTEFTLCGHSLGGATVAQFAVDHPEIVSGLVLLDPADPGARSAGPVVAGATASMPAARGNRSPGVKRWSATSKPRPKFTCEARCVRCSR
ncbi:MAG: pimeloyl-ACP methyl ester carboxylesterase [Candidatus Azotimanducaceae bacterium]|jgi:pimeloyl-ACP methyl ester carboxylesterase